MHGRATVRAQRAQDAVGDTLLQEARRDVRIAAAERHEQSRSVDAPAMAHARRSSVKGHASVSTGRGVACALARPVRRTNAAKRRGTRRGKQWVRQPDDVVRTVRRARQSAPSSSKGQ